MILVDTNILVDIASGDRHWATRSIAALAAAASRRKAFINDVIFSEFSTGFASARDCEAEIRALGLTVERIPFEALFLAGKAFLAYRRRGGVRTGTLPDFFIGAHAKALGVPLLSRDKGRYETYFPNLVVETP